MLEGDRGGYIDEMRKWRKQDEITPWECLPGQGEGAIYKSKGEECETKETFFFSMRF